MAVPRLALLLSLPLVAAACGVGDDGPPSTPEPRICEATFTVSGTFTLAMPAPDEVNNDTGDPPGDGKPDINGCWPVGTWAFTAALVDNTCKTPPTPLAEYRFNTTFIADPVEPGYMYTLVTPSPATTKSRIGVSSGGGGLCEGKVELFSEDGKQTWILEPALNVFNTSGPLTGVGEYAEWNESQTYP
jgi:hypothetical protein